jgi:predicted nucleic acid-binding protein
MDSNVLLRMAEVSHPLSAVTVSATHKLRLIGNELVVVPQCIYEFWNVATRTAKANGLGLSPNDAKGEIESILAIFRLLRDERGIYEEWFDLVNKHQISGVNSFDTRLAAAMSRHSITHLLTFNPSDFRRYSHINLIDPNTV